VIGELVTSETEGPLTENELGLIQRLLPLTVATIDDRSWRVRWTAAAKFANVIKAYNPIPGAMDALIPAYEKLLQDPEAEVRTAATFNLALVAQGCEAKVLPTMGNGADDEMTDAASYTGERVSAAERLVKRVTSLTEDDSEHVRAALAMVATELAPILGKDATITHLVPPILLLLRDAASEVRLNLISSLESLNKVIGVDLLSQSLLPAILDLAHDGKWR
jgi:serine/threonine-protein phosphatase 2A regulatory subunit A